VSPPHRGAHCGRLPSIAGCWCGGGSRRRLVGSLASLTSLSAPIQARVGFKPSRSPYRHPRGAGGALHGPTLESRDRSTPASTRHKQVGAAPRGTTGALVLLVGLPAAPSTALHGPAGGPAERPRPQGPAARRAHPGAAGAADDGVNVSLFGDTGNDDATERPRYRTATPSTPETPAPCATSRTERRWDDRAAPKAWRGPGRGSRRSRRPWPGWCSSPGTS
jgi:hypothetical protein